MDTSVEARIAALEVELAALRREVGADGAAERPGAPEASPPGPVSRRHLLWAGSAAAAGAAGMALGSAAPAGAQTGPTAASVTVVPKDNIQSTNVQAALEELDDEKAGLNTESTFGAVQTFLDAKFLSARFLSQPFIDVRAYGAAGNGSGNDATAIQNAITQAASGPFGTHQGTVYIPPGVYNIGGPITVPNNVDLWGGGGHGQVGNGGTVLVATNSTARLVFQGEGGQSGNFAVRGNGMSPTNGLVYLGSGVVERAFVALRVTGSATDGMVIEAAQNCTFTQCMIAQHGHDGVVLDQGTGGHVFVRCEFGACTNDGVVIRETLPSADSGAYPYPQHNLFLHCIFERAGGPNFNGASHAQLNISASKNTMFSHCVFSRQTDPTPQDGDPNNLFLVECSTAADPQGKIISSTTFDHCIFTAGKIGGLHNNGAGVSFSGFTTFRNAVAVQWDGNAYGDATGTMHYEDPQTGQPTVRWRGSGAWQNKVVGSNLPFLAFVEPTANLGMRVQRFDEPGGYRFNVSRDGEIAVSDGTTFSPKARWKLQGDGSGWETPDEVALTGGPLAFQEVTAHQAPTPVGVRANIYVHNNKLVVAWRESSTTTQYKWLPLNGTTTGWLQATNTPPN
jgi:hypothetical protein